MVFDEIKKDNISQRKGKDPMGSETSYLISKISTSNKNRTVDGVTPPIDDGFCYLEIRSYIKQMNQLIESLGDSNPEEVQASKDKIEFMKKYLPHEITEDVITSDIISLMEEFGDNSPKVMGRIIGALKKKYGDSFDGPLVSKLTKDIISS